MVNSESLADSPAILNLLGWAKDHGTYLDNRVEIYQDPTTGLSFRASTHLPAGIHIAVSSTHTFLSYLNATECLGFSAHSHDRFPSEFVVGLNEEYPHIIGHFFLMQQFLKKEDSFWWFYIQTLPQPSSPDLPTPIWWSDEDLAFLEATNAEPAVQLMKQFWKADYERGIALLVDHPIYETDYNFELYKWAATIFSTRSFRPSLTLPCLEPDEYGPNPSSASQLMAIDHAKTDKFSILLPVVDIGNHNGQREVEWTTSGNGGQFCICTTKEVERGSQVYNFYGNKSNSELLAGYGFILPDHFYDGVNLKLLPSANVPGTELDPFTLRRSQTCHKTVQQGRRPGEEWMYRVSVPRHGHTGPPELQFFSHGLIDTLSCMGATSRERKFLAGNLEYCVEHYGFRGPMCRNYIQSLRILFDKLWNDSEKIRGIGNALGPPRNSNQTLALEYRNRQALTLEASMKPLRHVLQTLIKYNLFCEHPHHSSSKDTTRDQGYPLHDHVQFISLDCAYDWLRRTYPQVYRPFSTFVSELEEEPGDEPRWDMLAANGWASVYWTAWIFIVHNLLLQNSIDGLLDSCHVLLRHWLSKVRSMIDDEATVIESAHLGYGDAQEKETIEELFTFILTLPDFLHFAEDKLQLRKLKAFAMCMAWDQTIEMKDLDEQHHVAAWDSQEVSDQKYLCITNQI